MKNSKKDIVHIYFGSQGAAGLYIHEIYSTLKKQGFKQELFLSHYYPFAYGKKIFFKYSDLASGIKKSKFRLYIRGVELLIGLFFTFLFIIIYRPKIVNYSLITSYISDIIFLRFIKLFSNSKIVITCHDVMPFGENKESILSQIAIRKKIFKFADFFIVHNENSIFDLNEIFNIATDKILRHPFPLMDLHKLIDDNNIIIKKNYDFSFIGHFRDNKGVDVLIEAWKLFHDKFPKAKLLLAGNLPEDSTLDFSRLDNTNTDLKLKYLSDTDYFYYVKESRNVILPYKSGTNSGVVYNLINMKVNVIYSDLPMFLNNTLLDKRGQFKVNCVKSLYEKMCEYYQNDDVTSTNIIEAYAKDFDKCVLETYEKILKK